MPLNHISEYSELTDKQFLLIGKIVIEFSNLEFLLGVLLTRLLITPEFLGRTYTDQIYAFKLIEAINNALDIHEKRYRNKIITNQKAKEIKVIINTIKAFRPLRNKFAHYCWSRRSDEKIFGSKLSGKIPLIKKDKKNLDNYILITNKELQLSYDKAYAAVDTLQNIIATLPELKEDSELFNKLTSLN